MKAPARPTEEARRLEALRHYDLLDTGPEQGLDDLTALAAEICETPISLLSLIDEQRQWFKSRIGFPVAETPRNISFCGHTILERELLVVPDALEDERFADNPLVTGEPHMRFYAGAPLVNAEGQALGTLCVIDHVPRQLDALQRKTLTVLSRQAMAQLELRRQACELARSERLLRAIFDSEPECVKLLDSGGSLRMMNRAGLAMIEADSFEQVAGHYLHSLVTPEHQASFKALTERVLRGASGTLEFQIVGLKGAGRWLETHAAPLHDERGQVTGLLGITRDITERKRADVALAESESRLRLALDAAHMGTFDWDVPHERITWSRGHEELWGFQPGEFGGSYAAFADRLHPDDVADVNAELARCIAAREPYSREFRVVWPDGSVHWIAGRGEFTFDASGQPVRMRGAVMEVTQRKQAEEALRVSHERFQIVARATNDAVWDWNLGTNTVWWNEGYQALFGYAPEETEPTVESWTKLIHPDDVENVLRGVHELLDRGGHFWSSEYRVRRRDGTYAEIFDRGYVIQDAQGRSVRMIGAMQDVTARKQAEQRVQQLNRVYAVLSDINQTIVRENDPRVVLSAACRIAVEKGRFAMAWIGLTDAASGRLRIVAHAGATDDTLQVVEALLDHERTGCRCESTLHALRAAEHGVCNDIASDPSAVSWRDAALQRGYRSMAALPLKRAAVAIGTLNLYASQPQFFDADEMRLLDELATDIAFALELHDRETERHRVEQALGESEARFRQLAESIQEVFWLTDPAEARMLYVSPAYELIWGRTCASLYASPHDWQDAIHPEDRERVIAAGAVKQAAGTYDEEYRVVRPDGGVRWVRDRAFPVRDAAGRVERIAGVAEDVTARHEAEMELRRRQEEFRSLIENASDIIMVINGEGIIRFQSPSAERILGYPPSEMIGRNALEFVHPDEVAQAAAGLRDALAEPSTLVSLEYRCRHRDGTWRVLQSIGRNVPHQAADGFIAINSRDITEHRRLEEQLRHAQKMEAIGRLAGGVAHDFNNILAVIHGYGSLLMAGAEGPDDVVEAAEQIVEAAERAANLTRQLLAFGRRQLMQPRTVDLNEVIVGLAKMLQRILLEHIHLELRLRPRPLLTRADGGMLDQVLMNLVVNARDAMPDGGRLVIATSERSFTADDARALPDARPGRYACLRVTDTGSGISSDDLPRIFEPFFTTKERGKGTGLGLATVFGIVKQHDGFVRVGSKVGHGTTFEVFLPVSEAGQQADEATSQPTPSCGTETILLVEDDAAVRRLTRAVLERAGYRVLEATNGVAALQIWEHHRDAVHLLFTDLVMPEGISGRELMNRLQTEQPELRVVFTSGYSAEIAGQDLLLREGENFVQKPASPQQILETIRCCLDR